MEEDYMGYPEMEEEDVYLGTYGQYKDFIESSVWKDLSKVLSAWLEGLKIDLEVETEYSRMLGLQGGIKGIKLLLALPQQILDDLATDLEQKEEDE